MRAELRQIVKQADLTERQLQWKASIVNVSSSQGLAAEPGFPSFAASSHAIVGMTRTSAADYIKHGIRINCVNPGPTDTPELEASGSKEKYLENLPLQREGVPEEVAAAVVFLLSPEASAISRRRITCRLGMVAVSLLKSAMTMCVRHPGC